MENRFLYLAYGSNMNSGQMKERCPSATFVDKGILDGYELVFDGYSERRGGLVADINRREGESVPYVIWSIDNKDKQALDVAEGYPKHYAKVAVQIGNYTDVVVYVMTDYKKTLKRFGSIVSKEYEKTIRDAYIEYGFDQKNLDFALMLANIGAPRLRQNTNKNYLPARTKAHIIDDMGTAIFHLHVARSMATRSVIKNDYGLDEIVDVVYYDPEFIDRGFLIGKMFGVQIKSSTRGAKSIKLTQGKTRYLYENNLPCFIVAVNIVSKKIKFANVRCQVRQQYAKYKNEKKGISFRFTRDSQKFSFKHVFEIYGDRSESLDKDRIEQMATNQNLLNELDYELNRGSLEYEISSFCSNFKTELDYLTKAFKDIENQKSADMNAIWSLRTKIWTYIGFVSSPGDSIVDPTLNDRTDTNEKKLRYCFNVILNYQIAFEMTKKLVHLELDYWEARQPNIATFFKAEFSSHVNNQYFDVKMLVNHPFRNITINLHLIEEQKRFEKLEKGNDDEQ